MPSHCTKVARGLLLYGEQIEKGTLDRQQFLKRIDVRNTSFRDAGEDLGAKAGKGGLRFFDSSERSHVRFGPGAGLVLGISVGTSSLRAAIVDANGVLYHSRECAPFVDQLSLAPAELLDRIRALAAQVLTAAFKDERLLVYGALPFLGVSVGWGSPVNREKRPLGLALRHPSWHKGVALNERVSQHLNIPRDRSHALNDAHAAAISVAWAQTREREHIDQRHPRMAIVLRLAGGISGASIIVEPPKLNSSLGQTSGFPDSILMGGMDMHAGEIGHVPLDRGIIAARNEDLPDGLLPLEAHTCSCTHRADPQPPHLEAYAAAPALAQRIAPGEPQCNVLAAIRANPGKHEHRRALEDVGALVGHALLGPVAMLDPVTITITGSLAFPIVRRMIAEYISEAQPFGGSPDIRALDAEEDRFIRAQGAALVVLRHQVHRRLDELLGGKKAHVSELVAKHTVPLRQLPWET